MITKNGKFDFSKIELKSKTGKFIIQDRYDNSKMYEVTHEAFREFLVLVANIEHHNTGDQINTLPFLLNQIEMTDTMFQASMIDYRLWTIRNDEDDYTMD